MLEAMMKKIKYSKKLPVRVLEALDGKDLLYWLEGDWADLDGSLSIQTNLDEIFIEMRKSKFNTSPLSFVFHYFSHVINFTTVDFYSKFTRPGVPDNLTAPERDRCKIGYISIPIYDEAIYSQDTESAKATRVNNDNREKTYIDGFFQGVSWEDYWRGERINLPPSDITLEMSDLLPDLFGEFRFGAGKEQIKTSHVFTDEVKSYLGIGGK